MLVSVYCRCAASSAYDSNDLNKTLLMAAGAGDKHTVEQVLNNGADSTFKLRNDGYTALHLAAQNGHVEVVKLLIDSSADPNCIYTMDMYNHTSLHLAAKFGHTAVVEQLLNYCADKEKYITIGSTSTKQVGFGFTEDIDIGPSDTIVEEN